MGDESENVLVLYIQDGVLIKYNPYDIKHVDFLNNVGSLSIVEYKSDLGKCIEWNQCDVSIESDDQEWAIVRDSKGQMENLNENSKNSRNPIIQIPIKNLLSFKKKHSQLTFFVRGSEPTTFCFQHGQVVHFVNFLTTIVNASVSKRDLYIVRDQKEVQVLEKSFAELDLFTDDNTRSDAVWSFIKRLQEYPYETTLNAFCKVTDAFTYKPEERREMDHAADLLNGSLSCEELPDFQGRISTEDYELITKGTPLPPRILPLRSPPMTQETWTTFFDDTGRIRAPEMAKEMIFHGGITPEGDVRSEAWKFLLDYYPWNSTSAEREIIKDRKRDEYLAMKHQWETMTATQEDNFAAYKERKSLIEKDVCRTDRNLPFFAGDNNSNLEKLQSILMTYVMYNFDLGYVQGMSDLLSPLLIQLKDEVDAFWCFVGFMNKVYQNFSLDQAGMKEQLHQLYCILCCIEPELSSYLENQDSNNMSFCFRWLLIWFKREFSFEEICTLWEVLWTETLCKNFHLLICAAILDTEKETLMSNKYGFTEILKHVNELAHHINLDTILRKAEGIYIQLSAAAKIPSPIREIIGLGALLEDESPSKNDSAEKSESNENDVKPQNGLPNDQGTDFISTDPDELNFQNAISLQYL